MPTGVSKTWHLIPFENLVQIYRSDQLSQLKMRFQRAQHPIRQRAGFQTFLVWGFEMFWKNGNKKQIPGLHTLSGAAWAIWTESKPICTETILFLWLQQASAVFHFCTTENKGQSFLPITSSFLHKTVWGSKSNFLCVEHRKEISILLYFIPRPSWNLQFLSDSWSFTFACVPSEIDFGVYWKPESC